MSDDKNRYFLFAGEEYYPNGGMSDLIGKYEHLHEAISEIEDSDHEWANVFDIKMSRSVIDWLHYKGFSPEASVSLKEERDRLIKQGIANIVEIDSLKADIKILATSPCKHVSVVRESFKHGVLLRCQCCLKIMSSAKTLSELSSKIKPD